LEERIKSGNPRRGMANIGEGLDTEGSRWIIQVVDRADPRPVQVAIWGGSTELAQALWRVRKDRDAAALQRFLDKLRVYAINHQDDTGPWIIEQFPDLFYILSRQPEGRDKREAAYRGMYLSGDESLTSRAWVDQHVRLNHGPLGALFPMRTWTEPNPHGVLKEGDTPSWFYFLPNGLSDPEHPDYGGWGGRFKPDAGRRFRDAQDTVGSITHARATVWRWRPAYQAEFQARMDWCVRPFAAANHSPRAIVNGDQTRNIISMKCAANTPIRLDAAASTDPDRHRLHFQWWHYREPSTFGGAVAIKDDHTATATFTAPPEAACKSIHIVLEVKDDGVPALTSYRRVVLQVERSEAP
jgi:hypothetical protein